MIAWMRFGFLVLLLALGCFGAAKAGAQDSLQLQTNYYTVTGATLPEIRRSIDQARPQSGAGPHDGLTAWHITWHTAIRQRGGVSRLSAFTTRTTIHITLPRWQSPTNAAPEVVKAWQDYLATLQKHEQGHVQLARATVTELHLRVKAVPPGGDGEVLRQQIEELARGIVATGTERHENYDRLTQHGSTQGARLGLSRIHATSGPARPPHEPGSAGTLPARANNPR
jgi:predicted secreted Zn-dependent protease